MKKHRQIFSWIFPLILSYYSALGTEFSIDLKKSAEECFYEVIKDGVLCDFEFQVVSGGNLDIDVFIEAPSQKLIYKEIRKEYDRFQFNTTESGEHVICFNNRFSTFTDKSVFISFEAGRKNLMLEQIEKHNTEMTFMETTSNEIHNYLENIISFQTHYKLQEGYGRRFTEELNDRVLWWSLALTFLIFVVAIAQVLVLRRLFKDSKPTKTTIILAHQTETFYGYS